VELTKGTPTGTGEFYQTNAQRLAAGLPPLAPKRRHFTPTRVGIAARAPSPTAMTGGLIRVLQADSNSLLGWLHKSPASGFVDCSPRGWDHLSFSFTYYDPTTPFELRIGDTASYPYLGAAATSFATSSSTTGSLVRTNSALEYGPPKVVGHSSRPPFSPLDSESFVWKYNPANKEITGTWVNPDKTSLDTYFYFNPGTTEMVMSGHPRLPSNGFINYRRTRLFWDTEDSGK